MIPALRQKFPTGISLLLALLFPAVSLLGSVLLVLVGWDWLWYVDSYLVQLIVELMILLVMLLLMRLLRMGYIFSPRRAGFRACLLPTLPIAIYYTLALLSIAILYSDMPLRSGSEILWYVLCMLAIGITEELVFRGLITRMLYDRYGHTSVGVWLSVLTSSLLFGLVHLINASSGAALSGVLIQVVAATALGMCFSAIYLRTGSLWTVALLHSYMDFCALMDSGIYDLGSITETLSNYDLSNLVAAVVYGALALFLLRPSQLQRITLPGAKPKVNHVLGLMAAVFLLSGIFSAVTVMTIR